MGLIKKPNELTVKNALSALIYGQPGMGKTTLALSSPSHYSWTLTVAFTV